MKRSGKIVLRAALIIGAIAVLVGVCTVGVSILSYNLVDSEADSVLFDRSGKHSSTVLYANADTDGEVYVPKEYEIFGGLKKLYYPKEEISDYLVDGFIAVEDRKFYTHSGVDFKRTLGAALNYIFRTKPMYGASTITQQVVKNVSGDNEAKITRKLAEIVRARRLERRYEKDDILEVYLNVVPMSENIYGVGYASRAYFGKEPSEILPEEAATIIGITNAPTAYNPYTNPEKCLAKRNTVLSVMCSEGVISDEEYDRAVNTALSVLPKEEGTRAYNSWFTETVIDEVSLALAEKYSVSIQAARAMLAGGGYSIYTTVDTKVQAALEEYFENSANLNSDLEYAMTVLDSKNGDLVGIIGRSGKKEGNLLLNHATVPHTPASALKPIALYAPLVDEGKINWATVLDDSPVSFSESGGEYKEYPRNSPNIYTGLITVKDALRLSKNTIAVRLCKIASPIGVYTGLLKRFGFKTLVRQTTENGKNLTDIAISPMALGQLTRGVSLLELTSAYSSFPREGIFRKARSFLEVVDADGRTVLENKLEDKRVWRESTARIMNHLLSEVVECGTAKDITLKESVACAGKTGTSALDRDKLFVGYTPYYTAGVWCGSDTGTVSASQGGHLRAWDTVMKKIHETALLNEESPREFSTEGLLYLPYCKDSGCEYAEDCALDVRGERIDYGYFTEDNRPMGRCTRHVRINLDGEDISLIKTPERDFPKEIEITDDAYSYKRYFRNDFNIDNTNNGCYLYSTLQT